MACSSGVALPAQPGVDGGRSDLAGADRLHGRARAVFTSPPAKTPGTWSSWFAVRDDKAAIDLDAAAFEDSQVGALADGEDDVIGFELSRRQESNFGSKRPLASLTCSQNWKTTAPSSSKRNGPQRGAAAHLRRRRSRSRADWPASRGASRGRPCPRAQRPGATRSGDVDGDVAAANDDNAWPNPHRVPLCTARRKSMPPSTKG